MRPGHAFLTILGGWGFLALGGPQPLAAQSKPQTAKPEQARETGALKNARITGGLVPARREEPNLRRREELPVTRAESLMWTPGAEQAKSTDDIPVVTGSPAVAVSRHQAGVLWVLTLLGGDTEFYAADTLGRDFGTFRLGGAINNGWTAMSLGPCGIRTCLYIGDMGDADERRNAIMLYRVPEPSVPYNRLPRVFGVTGIERLEVRFPDGPHDAGAMYLSRDGSTFIITSSATKPSMVYRVPAAAWLGNRRAQAEALGKMVVEPGQITGAAVSPDGQQVAIRTAQSILFFGHTDKWGPALDTPLAACDLSDLNIAGRGLDWLDDRRLVLTTIKGYAPVAAIFVVRCAAP